MDALQDTSEKYNMRNNTKKTEIMRMSTRLVKFPEKGLH